MANTDTFDPSFATAKDASIETVTDVRGKRASLVRGGHALNCNVSAYFTLAGLTWNNLEKGTVSNFVISFDAIIEGRRDAAYSRNICKRITRQVVIKTAWDTVTGGDPMDSDALNVDWPKARAFALRKAGFKSVF